MGTIFAVVRSNLTVAYFEEKMFTILPQIYAKDFVDFFIPNYFRFLDDFFHKWLIQFNIQDFYKLMNELDPDLQFIFEELTKNISFLDINLKTINNKLHFNVYHKPTNSFSYLPYKSCHPPHTKNNIALLLARRIVRIVTDNANNRLQELKGHLLQIKHPEKIIDTPSKKFFNLGSTETMTKMLLPSLELKILIINFRSRNLKIALKALQIENFKNHLMIKNTPYYTATKEIKKFVSTSKI